MERGPGNEGRDAATWIQACDGGGWGGLRWPRGEEGSGGHLPSRDVSEEHKLEGERMAGGGGWWSRKDQNTSFKTKQNKAKAGSGERNSKENTSNISFHWWYMDSFQINNCLVWAFYFGWSLWLLMNILETSDSNLHSCPISYPTVLYKPLPTVINYRYFHLIDYSRNETQETKKGGESIWNKNGLQ